MKDLTLVEINELKKQSHKGTCSYCGDFDVYVEPMELLINLRRHKGKFGCVGCINATIEGRRRKPHHITVAGKREILSIYG